MKGRFNVCFGQEPTGDKSFNHGYGVIDGRIMHRCKVRRDTAVDR